jgi:heme O synthase-like polyprenyltransferase
MDQNTISTWGAIIISVVALLIYAGAFCAAIWLKSETLLNVLVGTAATNAATVVGFWVGSSASSRKKDDVIAKEESRRP